MEGNILGSVLGTATRLGHTRNEEKAPAAITTLLAFLTVLSLCMGIPAANGQTAPNVVLSQTTTYASFPNGSPFNDGDDAGTNMAVNSQGDLFVGTSYGGDLVEYTPGGTANVLGSYSNIGAIAIDSANNLYIANIYSTTIVKLPFVGSGLFSGKGGGAYAAFSAPSSSTPLCTGMDMVECTLPSGIVSGPNGIASMVIDSQGDLFYTSTNGGSPEDHALFECSAACMADASPTPTMLFQEPTNSAAQLLIGGLAVDGSGDVFFSDSAFSTMGSEESVNSHVNELTSTGMGSTGYSATPVVLYTYTNATPSSYDDEIDGVAVDAAGNLYFATSNEGIFGFPASNGVVNTSQLYTFSTTGAQGLTTDGKGNFYLVGYSNVASNNAATHITVGLVNFPGTTAVGSTATATNVTTIVNDTLSCSPTPTITFNTSGTASTEFVGATSGGCTSAGLSNASTFPTTVTFKPINPGIRTGLLTATDAAGNSGTATVSSIGVGQATAPNVVVSQTTTYSAFPNGSPFNDGDDAGTNMAVNSQGNLFVGTSYGGSFLEYTPDGAVTTLGTYSNIGAIAIDSANNLYIANIYSTTIVKLPFVAGTYPAFTAPSGTTPVCNATSTVECTLPSNVVSAPYGVASMIVDASGDLFYSSTNGGSSVDHSIFECAAPCNASSTPTMLFQEPTNSTAQLLVGGLAVDSLGNLFFSDSAISSTGSEESIDSNVNELAYTGTGSTNYSATPTVLYTYTNASPSNYDDEIDGVAVDAAGTLYFATSNDGVFGFTADNGVVNTSNLYTFSTTGAQGMTTDGNGNFYLVGYSNVAANTAATHITVGLINFANAATGTTSTANVTTIVNDTLGCSPTPAVTLAISGPAANYFSAAISGSCSSAGLSNASTFPATATYKPTVVGTQNALLTATDTAGNVGTAALTGAAAGQSAPIPTFSPVAGIYSSIQTVSLSDTASNAVIYYTTDGSTPTTASAMYTAPISVAVTETIQAIAAVPGDVNSAVASATYTINLPATATPTFTPGTGTYTSIQSVTIADSTAGAVIYYTTNGTVPTTSSMLYSGAISVSATETIMAIAVAPGYSTSTAGSAIFTINLPAATPNFSPTAGTYNAVQSVTITDATTGATIYYTIDGSTPTIGSTIYSTPIAVSATETIQAIAVAPGYSTSAVASSLYTIALPTFTLAVNPSALSIAAYGGEGVANVVITSVNTFANAVTFACSGLPVGATCTFTPTTVAPNSPYTVTSVLTISTAAAVAALHKGPDPFLPTAFALVFCILSSRKRSGFKLVFLLAITVFSLGMVSGCSSSHASSNPSPTTSIVTVTATSGTSKQTAALSLTVQ